MKRFRLGFLSAVFFLVLLIPGVVLGENVRRVVDFFGNPLTAHERFVCFRSMEESAFSPEKSGSVANDS